MDCSGTPFVGDKVISKNHHYNTLFSLFWTLKARHKSKLYQSQGNYYIGT